MVNKPLLRPFSGRGTFVGVGGFGWPAMMTSVCCRWMMSHCFQGRNGLASLLETTKLPCLKLSDYTPEVKHGTWKSAHGKGDSYWKPSFSGSMLNLGRVLGHHLPTLWFVIVSGRIYTWRIIPGIVKWLRLPPFTKPKNRPFGRGPTTRSLGGNNAHHGYEPRLQVMGLFSKLVQGLVAVGDFTPN